MGLLNHLLLALAVTISVTSWPATGYSREFYPYPWAPARRSTYNSCAMTGEYCHVTKECCNADDVCMTSFDPSPSEKRRRSTCENMKRELKYARTLGRRLKPSGQPCNDSHECADGCCRKLKGFRTLFKTCGTPSEDLISYTCVSAVTSLNDVLNDVL